METDVTTPFDRNENNASVPPNYKNSEELSPPSDIAFDMTKKKVLVIFNHFKFKVTRQQGKLSERKGTAMDVKSLRNTFEALGFEVDVHQDPDHEEILKSLREVSQLKASSTSCVAVAVMTHGDPGLLHAADRPYPAQDLFAYFLSDKCNLTNVPKLFFIQACRGDMLDSGRVVMDGEASIHLPTHANFLVVYSTVEDHVSWRDPTGSWLMQSLCDTLTLYSGKYDLLWMMTLVHREIAHNYASCTRDKAKHNKKQMPETKFSLTKDHEKLLCMKCRHAHLLLRLLIKIAHILLKIATAQ